MTLQRVSRYRVIRRLGAGGMGEVYLAQDTELERSVALKVMSVELAKDETQRKRFRTEARAASGLTHPNICVIHEVGETEDGRPFLAMEYVDGETLDKILQQRRLRIREVITLGIEVAEALEAAHARRIVHRDIKPANLMMDRHGRMKVLDFGLAKRFAGQELTAATTSFAQTKSGMLIGTPHYMSPEQVLGHELDARSDLFSLGVVLYELVAGQKPFLGRTVGEVINNVVNQKPDPLGLENPFFSPSLDGLIFQCLEKDPARRPASAKTLAQDLLRLKQQSERVLSPVPNGATSPSAPAGDALPPVVPRNPPAPAGPALPSAAWVAMGAGILALLFVAGWLAAGHAGARRHALGKAAADSPATAPPNSVAVLPFDNFSSEPDTEYLSDGLTEEITTALSRIHGLKVAARNSAFTFKGNKSDARQIGRELRVATLLEGSIRKVGKQIRVTAQLINVADGFHLWSETYDGPVDDIIAVQEQIAQKIAQRLQGESPAVAQAPSPRKLVPVEAHTLYLQGRMFWNKRTESGLKKATQLFQAAIDRAPDYADAHAGLAATYLLLPLYSPDLSRATYGAKARDSANRALALDPTCAEAHAVLANYEAEDHNYASAEDHFRRAIQLAPNYATAHHWYGRYLNMQGKREQGLAELKTAVELDPLSPVIRTTIPEWYFWGRDYNRAEEEARKVVALFPEFPMARMMLVAAMFKKGEYQEALAEIDACHALTPEEPMSCLEMKAYALARTGQEAEARRILAQFLEAQKQGKHVDGSLILIYQGLKEYDKALDVLEAMAKRQDLTEDDLQDPLKEELRQFPRFQSLFKKPAIE